MTIKLRGHAAYLMIALLITGSGAVYAHPTWGIAVDRTGQVYFSDLTTVWRIDSGGRLSVFRPKGAGHVHEISLDADGNLLGAENTYDPATKKFFSGIWKMTPACQSSYVVRLQEIPPKGTSVWRDVGGNSYYATEFPAGNLLVLRRTPGGEVTPLVGGEGAARDYRQSVPYGVGPIAFGADGSLFFTHGANVNKVSPAGRMTTLARDIPKESASGKSEATPLFGIVIDAAGNPIVADYGNRRVFRISLSENRISTLLRTDGLWYPTGVAVRGDDIYVLEVGVTPNHEPVGTRVRKLLPDGSVTALATVDANSTANAIAAEPDPRPDAPASLSEVPVTTAAASQIPFYLVFAVAAFLGAVLSILVYKGRRKFNFRKTRNE